MEVFPDLDDNGSSIAWNFVAMIWFDENYIRHLAKYEFMSHSEFFVLEKYLINNLEEKYNYLNTLKEEKIPFKTFPISRV